MQLSRALRWSHATFRVWFDAVTFLELSLQLVGSSLRSILMHSGKKKRNARPDSGAFSVSLWRRRIFFGEIKKGRESGEASQILQFIEFVLCLALSWLWNWLSFGECLSFSFSHRTERMHTRKKTFRTIFFRFSATSLHGALSYIVQLLEIKSNLFFLFNRIPLSFLVFFLMLRFYAFLIRVLNLNYACELRLRSHFGTSANCELS